MFTIFKKKNEGKEITFTIKGMHCTACAMNIDGALEDTEGVVSAETSYAKGQVKVWFNPDLLSTDEIAKVITAQGYEATITQQE